MVPSTWCRLQSYLGKQFRILRQQFKEDSEELKRIGVLQQIFLGDLPARAVEALNEMRRMEIAGDGVVRRLEALRVLHRLNPPDEEEGADMQEVGVLRIVCSDGLV